MNSRNPANRYIYARPPKPTYPYGPDGERVFRTVRDKLGDIIRVYRAVHDHRPGNGSWLARERMREAKFRLAAK